MSAGRQLISVIVPMYNGEKHLLETLSSLQAQTCGDFECLCIDDGSVDSSAEIVGRLAATDSRFVLVRQQNKGIAAARNRGLELAKGQYIAFLDQDDAIVPRSLELQRNVIESSGCVVVSAGIHQFSGSGKAPFVSVDEWKYTLSHTPVNDFFSIGGTFTGDVNVWGKLYRRDAIGDICFPEDVFGADDYVFSFRVVSRISSYARIESPLYLYRMHENNVTMQMPMRYIMGALRSREIVWHEMCDSTTIDTGMRRDISRRFAYDIMSWAIKKTCRRNYSKKDMAILRGYVRRLVNQGVLVPASLGDKIKCHMFLQGNNILLRLLFPRQFRMKLHS